MSKELTIEKFVYNFLVSDKNSPMHKQTLLRLLGNEGKHSDLPELLLKLENYTLTHPVVSPKIGHCGDIFVWSKPFHKAGVPMGGHKHNKGHVSLLVQGSVRMWVGDEEPQDYQAPCAMEIPGGVAHNLMALEDNTTAFCVFAVRDEDGELTTEFDGNMKHYDVDTQAMMRDKDLIDLTIEKKKVGIHGV